MKKNVASQTIGAQMVATADGSAFTGAVTVHVTGDGGTQGQGSVGSGACTHEGNGYHSYAPAQAETNFDHIAFTFVGTGAIPATVQLYTEFPQTGDSFSLANGASGFVATKGVVDDILTDTAEIGAAGAGLTNINLPNQTMDIVGNITGNLSGSVGSVTGAVGSVAGAVGSVTGNVGGNVVGSVASVTAGVTLAASAVQAIWDALTSALTTAGSIGKLLVDNINATVSSRMPTSHIAATAGKVDGVALVDTTTVNTDMRGTDSALLASGYTAPPSAADNAAGLLDAAAGVETGLTVRQWLRLAASTLFGKASGLGTATAVFRDYGDTKDRITATVDENGNRTAVTRDAT